MALSGMRNPGARNAGASSNQLSGWLHLSSTASDWQAQILVTSHSLSLWMARDVAWLFFGEADHV